MNSNFYTNKRERAAVQMDNRGMKTRYKCMRLLFVFLALSAFTGGTCVYAQSLTHKAAKKTVLATQDIHPSTVWVKLKAQYAGALSAPSGRVASLPGVTSARPLVPGSATPSGRRGPLNHHIDISRYHTLLLES
ncbi:MAG TPA: hypothetical protein VK658_00195, partial [Chryseolinea sp.]|nr:hypothetical protein [Chryseolinea sp.]